MRKKVVVTTDGRKLRTDFKATHEEVLGKSKTEWRKEFVRLDVTRRKGSLCKNIMTKIGKLSELLRRTRWFGQQILLKRLQTMLTARNYKGALTQVHPIQIIRSKQSSLILHQQQMKSLMGHFSELFNQDTHEIWDQEKQNEEDNILRFLELWIKIKIIYISFCLSTLASIRIGTEIPSLHETAEDMKSLKFHAKSKIIQSFSQFKDYFRNNEGCLWSPVEREQYSF